MRLDSLVATTNEILKLPRQPSASDLRGACLAGCRELRIMGDDEAFQALVAEGGANGAETNPDVRRVLDELSSFGAFVQEELRVMVEAGLDSTAAEALLDQARSFRQTVTGARLDPQTLRVRIFQLRDEVCDLAGLLEHASDAEDRRRAARLVLRKVAWVVGGGTIVLVNATATSLGQLYAGASISVGSGLVGYGLRGG